MIYGRERESQFIWRARNCAMLSASDTVREINGAGQPPGMHPVPLQPETGSSGASAAASTSATSLHLGSYSVKRIRKLNPLWFSHQRSTETAAFAHVGTAMTVG